MTDGCFPVPRCRPGSWEVGAEPSTGDSEGTLEMRVRGGGDREYAGDGTGERTVGCSVAQLG
jgi:hypothetical protein